MVIFAVGLVAFALAVSSLYRASPRYAAPMIVMAIGFGVTSALLARLYDLI